MASFQQLLFFLALLVVATTPLEAYARDREFFSKVSRPDPNKPVTRAVSPSASTSPFTKAADERGYGLFAKEDTYEYPPTTTNPTKSVPEEAGTGDLRLVESNEGHGSFYGGRYDAVEKQGSLYGDVQKQGMSDTRFLENGKYYYNVEAERRSNTYNNNNAYVNNAALYSDDDRYATTATEEEEGEEEEGRGRSVTYRSPRGRFETGRRQGSAYGRQGMSDTRFLENGKYFFDLEAERKMINSGYHSNNAALYSADKYENEAPGGEEEVYGSGKSSEYYGEERYAPEKESYSYEKEGGNGGEMKTTSTTTTPNRFPKYEFDSMEEYEKYEQGRSHQNEYNP